MSIMQEQPSRYTAYAKSLCPSWCTEHHVEPTDKNDLGAVHHKATVGTAVITDYYGNPAVVDVRLSQWDSLSTDAEDGRPVVHLWNELPDDLSPAGAMQVAQLLIRAAEVADRG